jgi:hypothetical protein
VAFDAKKLSGLDWAVVGAGAVAFIALFLPWWGISSPILSASVSGWSTSWGWLGALILLAAGAYLLAVRSGVDLSKMSVGPLVVVLGAASLGTLIVIIRWITIPSASYGIYGSYGPQVGIFLAIAAGIVQAVAAFMLFRKSGEKLPWDAKSSATPPPAPPTTPA